MNKQMDEDDFNEWIEDFFGLDPMMLNIVYVLWEAYRDKHTTGIGVIVETEPDKPIENSEIMELYQFLSEKGLQFKHKRDSI